MLFKQSDEILSHQQGHIHPPQAYFLTLLLNSSVTAEFDTLLFVSLAESNNPIDN